MIGTPPGHSSRAETQSSTKISGTQKLTGVALFVALAIILNLIVHVPAPFAPFLQFELWEIPIVASLLIFGFRSALVVALVNSIVLLFVNPGPLPSGPFFNLAAVYLTFTGLIFGHKVALNLGSKEAGIVASATTLAVIFRVVGMTFVNYAFDPMPPPIGFHIPVAAIVTLLPAIALFNALVALYTVPITYGLVREVAKRYKFRIAYPTTLKIVPISKNQFKQ